MANNKKTKTKEKTAIQKTHESALSEVKELKLTEETVLRYLNPHATKSEIALFLNQCKMFELNPWKREIYIIKYSSSDPATFVLGFEVFLKRAERAGKLSGWKAWTEGTIKTKDFKACLEIHRKDWKMPFYHEVFWDEYAQYKRDQKTLTRFWDQKCRTMLKKVVISQGFRMCFPDELGGLPYVSEEMPVDHEKLPTEQIITVVPEEEKPKKEEPKAKKAKKPELETEEVPLENYSPPVGSGAEQARDQMEEKEEQEMIEKQEEETPEPPAEEEPEEVKSEPITAQTKRFITNALQALEADYGRKPTDVTNKICDRFETLSKGKVVIAKFPDDLTEVMGRKVLEWLSFTRKKEEEKRG